MMVFPHHLKKDHRIENLEMDQMVVQLSADHCWAIDYTYTNILLPISTSALKYQYSSWSLSYILCVISRLRVLL